MAVLVTTDNHLAAAIIPLKSNRTVSTPSLVCSNCSVSTDEQEGEGVLAYGAPRIYNSDTVEITDVGIPLLTRTGDNINAVIRFFYSTLELGAEAVASIVPSCEENKKEEEESGTPMPSAMDLLADSSDDDDDSVRTEAVEKNEEEVIVEVERKEDIQSSSLEEVEENQGEVIEVEIVQQVSEVVTKSSFDNVEEVEVVQQVVEAAVQSSFDNGDGCFISVFTCSDKELISGASQERKDDATLVNESTDDSSLSMMNDIKKPRRLEHVKSLPPSSPTFFQRHLHFSQKQTTPTDDEEEDTKKDSNLLSRVALLKAEVITERAELELKKIRLESRKIRLEGMRVEEEMMDILSMVSDSYDTMDSTSFDDDEEEGTLNTLMSKDGNFMTMMSKDTFMSEDGDTWHCL